jgi:hypothetical protein
MAATSAQEIRSSEKYLFKVKPANQPMNLPIKDNPYAAPKPERTACESKENSLSDVEGTITKAFYISLAGLIVPLVPTFLSTSLLLFDNTISHKVSRSARAKLLGTVLVNLIAIPTSLILLFIALSLGN